MRLLRIFIMLILAFYPVLLPSIPSAAGVPVAVFPLQELGEGRYDANLPLTRILADRLANSGIEVIGMDTVIVFMANERIRTPGYLKSFNISRIRNNLGAAFVLLGTVVQRREKPESSIGLTLNLVRTSDARIIWSYVGSFSTSEQRRMLGIGEPESTEDLQYLLLNEIMQQWPWQSINAMQQVVTITVDSVILVPKFLRPGDEIHCRVRLRKTWPADQAPQIFFKADEQLYPATLAADGLTYEATWVAGEEKGSFPVMLVLEWPQYGRTETVLLGSYLIDDTPPLFELEFRGTKLLNDVPVFNHELVIVPRLLIREPMSRWRLSFTRDNGKSVGVMEGVGNLPDGYVWSAKDQYGTLEDGVYEVAVEAWDRSGNPFKAQKKVELNRNAPHLDVAMERNEEGLVVDLKHSGKVPLAFWRLAIWNEEGRIINQSEGNDLPVTIGIELPDTENEQEINGYLIYQDVMGKKVREEIGDLLPKLGEKKDEAGEEKPKGISEIWVNEF